MTERYYPNNVSPAACILWTNDTTQTYGNNGTKNSGNKVVSRLLETLRLT